LAQISIKNFEFFQNTWELEKKIEFGCEFELLIFMNEPF